MSKLLEQVIDEVRKLPEHEQDVAAAEIQKYLDAMHSADVQLSDEQVAEVRRRLEDPNPRYLTLDEFDDRLRRFGV